MDVEKVHFPQNSQNLGDRKCQGKLRKSFVGSVSVLVQDPALPGHFAAATNYTGADQILSVAVADINGDNKPDLVIANGGGIVIRLQDPSTSGVFLAPVAIGK